MLRRLSLIVIALAAVLAPALPAHGQTNYPLTPTCTITRSNGTPASATNPVQRGETASFTSPNWQPNSLEHAVLHSDPVDLGTYAADGNGVVRGSFKIPATFPPGAHYLEITGTGGDGRPTSCQCSFVSSSLSQVGDQSAERPGTGTGVGSGSVTAHTGFGAVMQLVGAGISLLIAGAALFVASRKRRQTQPQAA